MRIGIFTDDYLPRISGVISSIQVLRAGLIEQGHQVYLIVPNHPDLVPEPYVVSVSSARPPLLKDMRAALPSRKYIERILDLDLDIVHSMTQYNMGILADYIAHKADIPHVTTMHTIVPELLPFYPAKTAAGYMYCATLYLMYFGERARLSWPALTELTSPKKSSIPILKRQVWSLLNVFMNNTDHVIVPSQHTKEQLQQNNTTVPCSVIPNGVNPMFYGHRRRRTFMKNGQLRVLCVGRLSSEKRQDAVIEAIQKVPGAHLDIIGDGPTNAELHRLGQRLKVADRLSFHGAQNATYVLEHLLSADVLILASHNFDTQGLVLLEAAATGLPVIYCDKKLADSVSPDASLFVDYTSSGIAEGFAAIQQQDLAQMSRAARRFARKFDYHNFAHMTENLYRSLIS